jgi:hypothetical protein
MPHLVGAFFFIRPLFHPATVLHLSNGKLNLFMFFEFLMSKNLKNTNGILNYPKLEGGFTPPCHANTPD